MDSNVKLLIMLMVIVWLAGVSMGISIALLAA